MEIIFTSIALLAGIVMLAHTLLSKASELRQSIGLAKAIVFSVSLLSALTFNPALGFWLATW